MLSKGQRLCRAQFALWAGTVKAHQFLWPEAHGAAWLSLPTCAMHRLEAGLSTVLIKAKAAPRGEPSTAHLPRSKGTAAFFPARTAERACPHPGEPGAKAQGRGRGSPRSHAGAREQPQPRACPPRRSVSAPRGTFGKAWEWQGKDLALTITQPPRGVSCYEHRPETSVTLTHRKSSEVDPSEGRTMLFVSSASMS